MRLAARPPGPVTGPRGARQSGAGAPGEFRDRPRAVGHDAIHARRAEEGKAVNPGEARDRRSRGRCRFTNRPPTRGFASPAPRQLRGPDRAVASVQAISVELGLSSLRRRLRSRVLAKVIGTILSYGCRCERNRDVPMVGGGMGALDARAHGYPEAGTSSCADQSVRAGRAVQTIVLTRCRGCAGRDRCAGRRP